MRRFILILGAFIILSPGIGDLFAQKEDLTDLKKKEEKRRKTTKQAKIRITDTNLTTIQSKGKSLSYIQVTGGYQGETESEKSKTTGKRKDVRKNKEHWQKLKNNIDSKIQKLKEKIKKGQSEINRLYTQYYVTGSFIQQSQIMGNINRMRAELEADKSSLKKSEQELEDLHDKARKAGVPPGWLR